MEIYFIIAHFLLILAQLYWFSANFHYDEWYIDWYYELYAVKYIMEWIMNLRQPTKELEFFKGLLKNISNNPLSPGSLSHVFKIALKIGSKVSRVHRCMYMLTPELVPGPRACD